MAACRLCGYRSPVGVTILSECPVCGEPCDTSGGHDGADAVVKAESGIEYAGGGVSRGTSPHMAQPWVRCDSPNKAFPSSCLNPELQSLLRLVPEEQNRKKRAQDAVRAAGGGALVLSCSDEDQSESDVVYIRPRVDPGMRVLKGRYNTQPRVAKAASMSVLGRLAHPLMGYDSMEALAPKARRRRQESVERLLRKTLAGGKANCADRPPWLLSRRRSSVELSRTCVKGARSRRCNTGCSLASAVSRPHLAVSVDALHHQRGSISVGPVPQEREREHEGHTGEPTACPETSDSPKETRDSANNFPFFHLRASERRREKPSLRRKRVATMRSVNGWVKYADPASTRRESSLDRRIDTLRKGGKRTSNSHPKVTASHLGRYGRRHGSRSSNGAFLTQPDSNGSPVVETRRDQGGGAEHRGGDPAGNHAGKRRGSGRAMKGKPFRVSVRNQNEGNQDDSSAAGADGRYGGVSGSAEPGRPTGSKIAEREDFLENLGVGDSAAAAAAAAAAEAAAAAGSVDGGGYAPGDPREPLDAANMWEAEGDTFTGEEAPRRATIALEETGTHEASARISPGWNTSRSQSPLTLDARNGARLAWDGDEPLPTGHSRSAWQLLRGAEADVPSQMTMLLQSFQDKVATRAATPTHDLRQTSVIVENEQRASSTPPPDGQRHRPLSREVKSPPGSPLEGFIRRQPASNDWVHRQSLPSLLTDRAGSPSSKPSTPTTARAGAVPAAARPRGKSLPSSKDSTTRMQRLDRHYVTVSDSWDGGQSPDRRKIGSRVTAKDSQGLGAAAVAVPRVVSGMFQTEGATVRGIPRASRRDASNGQKLSYGKSLFNGKILSKGNILSTAVPRPLLYVGGGSGFKLRSK